ncbi:hypothetical protein ACOZ4B_05280 [Haloferax prahovense]|uniref:hypothetical protein n=1 Tax=Haloferax prahovense TaxID=381852 RepID=UPI003C751447
MKEPDWAKILRYIHNHNGEIRSTAEPDEQGDAPSNEEHEEALYQDLRRKVDISNTATEEIVDTHKHLQNTGLVKFEQRSEYAALRLTTDGFEVAHERELSRRDNRINQSLVFFTFVLVLAQIIGVIPAEEWVKILSAFIILVGMLVVLFWSDILTP